MVMPKQFLLLMIVCFGLTNIICADAPQTLKPQIQTWLDQWGKANETQQANIISEILKAEPSTITDLAQALSQQEVQIRQRAVSILQKLEKNAAPVIPAIFQAALQDQSQSVRKIAIQIVAKQNPNALAEFRSAVLQNKNEFSRAMAIEALKFLQAKDVATIQTLVQSNAFDKNNIVKAMAASYVDKIGLEALPTLLKLATHKDQRLSTASMARIVAMDDKALPTLLESLKIKDVNLRKAVATMLGYFPKHCKQVAEPLLNTAVNDNDRVVQETAEKSLVALKAGAVPALQAGLKNKDARVRKVSIKILGSLGKDAAAAQDDIVAALKDPNSEVAAIAAKVYQQLAGVSSQNKTDLTKLVADLKHPSTSVRMAALKQLGEMGPKAGTAIPALGDMINGLDPVGQKQILLAAFQTLDKIGESAYPMLVSLQQSKVHEIRRCTVEILSKSVSKNKDVALAVVNALDDPYYITRDIAVSSLRNNKYEEVASKLTALLQSEKVYLRKSAVNLLSTMGKNASQAKATLHNISQKDPDAMIRKAAKDALARIP